MPAGSEEDFALDLITTILTGGRLSRLHRRLVIDEALATSVSCSNDTRVDAGSFWVFAESRREVDPARLEASIDEEIARLGTELVTPAELRRARRMLQASEAYDIETVSDLAEDLGEWAVDSDWRVFIDSQRRFDAVKPRTLREVAARLLQPRRRVVG